MRNCNLPKVLVGQFGDYVAIHAGRITPWLQSPNVTPPPKTSLGAPHVARPTMPVAMLYTGR